MALIEIPNAYISICPLTAFRTSGPAERKQAAPVR